MCHGNEHHGIDPNKLNSGHHDSSTQTVFLCTADKLQCWPMLARNGTYWRMLAFSLLRLSFIGTIASIVLSSSFIRKSPLGWPCSNLGVLLAQMSSVCLCLFSWDGFPGQICKNHLRRKQGCGPEKALNLSVSARQANCSVATCWHVELSTLSLLHISFNIHLSNRFSCSMKFFHSKRVLGLALRESWGVAYKKTLMSSVYLCLFSWDGFPGQTCKNHLRRIHGTALVLSFISSCASPYRYFGVDVPIYQTSGTWHGTGFSS